MKDNTNYILITLIVLFFGNCSGHNPNIGPVTLKEGQKVECIK